MHDRILDLPFNHLQLPLMDHGTDLYLGVDAIAHTQFRDLRPASFEKWLVEAAVNVTALDRQASLTAVHERAPYGAAGSDLQIGVVEHDHRVLAA